MPAPPESAVFAPERVPLGRERRPLPAGAHSSPKSLSLVPEPGRAQRPPLRLRTSVQPPQLLETRQRRCPPPAISSRSLPRSLGLLSPLPHRLKRRADRNRLVPTKQECQPL